MLVHASCRHGYHLFDIITNIIGTTAKPSGTSSSIRPSLHGCRRTILMSGNLFLVEPDNSSGLVEHLSRLGQLGDAGPNVILRVGKYAPLFHRGDMD